MAMSDCERAATCAARAELKLRASEPWISVSRSITETAGALGFRQQSRPLGPSPPSPPSSRAPSYWCSSDAPPPPRAHTDAPPKSSPRSSEPQLNSVEGSGPAPPSLPSSSSPSSPSSSSPSSPARHSEKWFPSSPLLSAADPGEVVEVGASSRLVTGSGLSPTRRDSSLSRCCRSRCSGDKMSDQEPLASPSESESDT
ncbi:hypothetical protein EYF80_065135 [Liparis tanakae]|uniref:Uncharacterized protein n=1 Tax=Liparis tanakae TaxID=230148 RepID=A0A4Z2E7H7_9TELE|nr:hypothetical protein EYF80_065135 [Liparis tanakae]